MKLNVGCGEHYADGWTNLDASDQVRCDLIVDPTDPLASFGANTADAIYLGHVLEHLWWHDVPGFLTDVHRVLKPGAPVMVTGPDMLRLLNRWAAGIEPWWLVEQAMEAADREHPTWPEATHKWDCHEARVVGALTQAGFVDVTPTDDFDGWPVTNWSEWQCAVTGRVPS